MPRHQPGTYALVLHAGTGRVVAVGRKGSFWLAAGWHVYVGSAFGAGGLAGRLGRHLGRAATKYWHIDYLTGVLAVEEAWFSHDPVKRECQWSGVVGGMPGAGIAIEGFGCSDCGTCVSHLYSFAGRPSLAGFRRRLRRAVPGHGEVGRWEGFSPRAGG